MSSRRGGHVLALDTPAVLVDFLEIHRVREWWVKTETQRDKETVGEWGSGQEKTHVVRVVRVVRAVGVVTGSRARRLWSTCGGGGGGGGGWYSGSETTSRCSRCPCAPPPSVLPHSSPTHSLSYSPIHPPTHSLSGGRTRPETETETETRPVNR